VLTFLIYLAAWLLVILVRKYSHSSGKPSNFILKICALVAINRQFLLLRA